MFEKADGTRFMSPQYMVARRKSCVILDRKAVHLDYERSLSIPAVIPRNARPADEVSQMSAKKAGRELSALGRRVGRSFTGVPSGGLGVGDAARSGSI